MPQRLNTETPDFEDAFTALLDAKRENDSDVSAVVSQIIASVCAEGDEALLALSDKYDNVKADTVAGLAVSAEVMQTAFREIDDDLRTALEVAAKRIKAFHEKQLPQDIAYTDDAGVNLGMRHNAVDAAGLYVPGGKAVYPSSVLMSAIPAAVAGVERKVMVTPGETLPMAVLAAAHIAGVDEVWRIGGAQAIAALAYGTQTIAGVDMIVGPGNAFVAEAKRQVFGKVGIDSIAGPSEILVLADGDNNPDWIAMDMLSQAEHDEAAQAILITDDAAFADAVMAAIDGVLPTLERRSIATASWRDHGAVIVVRSWQEAVNCANRIAAEHVQIATRNPEELGALIRHGGALFLGHWTPEAVGDYIAGPNHVLPTARGARFSSGLGVLDFMKRTTILECGEDALKAIGGHAMRLAQAEGLEAHHRSISQRMNK